MVLRRIADSDFAVSESCQTWHMHHADSCCDTAAVAVRNHNNAVAVDSNLTWFKNGRNEGKGVERKRGKEGRGLLFYQVLKIQQNYD